MVGAPLLPSIAGGLHRLPVRTAPRNGAAIVVAIRAETGTMRRFDLPAAPQPWSFTLASTIVLQWFDKNDKPQLKGSSSIKSHNDWLELTSMSFSRSDSGVGGSRGGSTTDKAISISFVPVNDAATVLGAASVKGTTLEKVVVKFFKTSGSEPQWYLQVEMKKAFVDSMQMSGDESAPVSASLTYDTQVVVYQAPEHTSTELEGSGPDDWSYESEEAE
jgi:type VI protein secretion system component Hcp